MGISQMSNEHYAQNHQKNKPKPKFTDDYYNQMVDRVKSGEKIKDVCKEFHVSTSSFFTLEE